MAKLDRQTISRRTVEALPVGGREAVYWDTELSGFGVRVYPSGSKVYLVQTRAGGKSRRMTVGRHGLISAERARLKAARLIADIKAGNEPDAVQRRLPARRRPHGRGGGGAVHDGARRGALQARHNAALPEHSRPPSPAGAGQPAPRGNRARARRGPAIRAPRDADHGEQGGGHAFPPVPHGRALGCGARGRQSLPFRTQVQGTPARTFSVGRRVPTPRPRAVRGRGRRQGPSERGGGVPAADAHRLPEKRDPDAALGRMWTSGPESFDCATRRRVRGSSPYRLRRGACWKDCRASPTIPG